MKDKGPGEFEELVLLEVCIQDKGLLKSKLGANTSKGGDRRKRLFTTTHSGLKQLRAAQDDAKR